MNATIATQLRQFVTKLCVSPSVNLPHENQPAPDGGKGCV